MRISPGSATCIPPALANNIKTSVRLRTPTSLPLILVPGKEEAETDGPVGVTSGGLGDSAIAEELPGSAGDVVGREIYPELPDEWLETGTIVAELRDGVGGPLLLGLTGSVTQSL
jgi:hypothetical protein